MGATSRACTAGYRGDRDDTPDRQRPRTRRHPERRRRPCVASRCAHGNRDTASPALTSSARRSLTGTADLPSAGCKPRTAGCAPAQRRLFVVSSFITRPTAVALDALAARLAIAGGTWVCSGGFMLGRRSGVLEARTLTTDTSGRRRPARAAGHRNNPRCSSRWTTYPQTGHAYSSVWMPSATE